jgi:hypothetical protein
MEWERGPLFRRCAESSNRLSSSPECWPVLLKYFGVTPDSIPGAPEENSMSEFAEDRARKVNKRN